MIAKMKKQWLLWLIIGAVLLGFGIFFLVRVYTGGKIVIPFGTDSDYPGLDLLMLISGALMMLLAVYLIFPNIRSAAKGFKIAYAIEFGLALFVAIFGFLVPFVTALFEQPYYLVNLNFSGKNSLAEWYAVIFYIHGVIKLAECTFSAPKRKGLVFWLGILLVTLGVVLYFKGPEYVSTINIIIAWAIAIAGAFFTLISIAGCAERKGKA